MTNYWLLLLYFIATFYLLATTVTAGSTYSQTQLQSPQQPFESQLDIQHIASLIEENQVSHIEQIPLPVYVSALTTDIVNINQPNTTDHSNTTDHYFSSAIKASIKVCKKIGGEKVAATISYLFVDRPWQHWRQKVSRSYSDVKDRYDAITYNYVVKTIVDPSLHLVRDFGMALSFWCDSPYLEWHFLKSNLVGLWQQYYNRFMYWYLDIGARFSFYHDLDYDDDDDDSNRSSSDGELEPSQHGCYYDVLFTIPCVDEQELRYNTGLKVRVKKLLDDMVFEERAYTARLQDYMAKTIADPSLHLLPESGIVLPFWCDSPHSECHFLKWNLVGLWQQHYNRFLSWYLDIDARLSFNDDLDYDDDSNTNNSYGELEPGQRGCYYDDLGTILCMDEQELRNNMGLKVRMKKLLDGMTFEERAYSARFQQSFIYWATTISTKLTNNAMARIQKNWVRHTRSMYQFLDDALHLTPCIDNNNNNFELLSDIDDDPAFQFDPSPPVVLSSSTSPYDVNLYSTFALSSSPFLFFISQQQERTTPFLFPIPQQHSTTCSPDMTDINILQLLDPYNKIQYEYLVEQMQMEIMQDFKMLERKLLHRYYYIMISPGRVSTPQHWTMPYDIQPAQPLQKLPVYRPAFKQQQLHQEIRLFLAIRLQRVFTSAIQQLFDATEKYDATLTNWTIKETQQIDLIREWNNIFLRLGQQTDAIWMSANIYLDEDTYDK